MDGRIAETVDRLRGLVETYGAERLAIAAVAVVVLLSLLAGWRRRRRPGAASRSAETDYARLEQLDISEQERLYRVIAERPGWDRLADRLRREFSTRLRSKDNVLRFIAICENHRLPGGLLAGLEGADVEADMRAVAAAIAGLAEKSPEDSAGMLQVASRIDPDNFRVVLALAGDHYQAGRFREALPLLERGIPVCRDAVEGPRAGAGDELRPLLQRSMAMYEACLEREAPA